MIDHLSHEDAAYKFSVSKNLDGSLVRDFKRDPSDLLSIEQKQVAKKKLRFDIQEQAFKLLKANCPISKADIVFQALPEE